MIRLIKILSFAVVTASYNTLNVAQCNVQRKSKDPSQTQTANKTEEVGNKIFLSHQIVLFQLNF